jgi:hypothetical protein
VTVSEASTLPQTQRKESGGERDYGLDIRAAARGLWSGVFDEFQFVDSMISTVIPGLNKAWREGAAECGIKPDEFSAAELAARDQRINEQMKHIFAFAQFITGRRRALFPRGKRAAARDQVMRRALLWSNEYDATRVQAAAMACGNKKKMWKLGQTEEHCDSCFGFDGRVYRYETWAANGALPKTRDLCCRGYRCDCDLVDTDKRLTPGKFPARLLCR